MRTIALVLMLALFATAAPRPKGDKATLYYPTNLGDRWILGRGTGADAMEIPEKEVVDVDWKDGAARVTVKTGESRITFEVSDRGVYWIANDGENLEKPWCYLKLPAKRGEKWENTGAGATTAYAVVSEEQVETPAGKFTALKVEVSEAGKVRMTNWWAPGVGLIKQDDGSPRMLVLKSFTPGRK